MPEYHFTPPFPASSSSSSSSIQIAYEVFSPPQHSHPDPAACPAVLLIAGVGLPGGMWGDHICGAIAGEGYRVIRYDHRDTGRSSHFGSSPLGTEEPAGDSDGSIVDLLETVGPVPNKSTESKQHSGVLQLLRMAATGAKPPDPLYTLADLANDAIRVIDHLSVKCVHLIGHCFGGMVAQVMAIDNPSRVGSLSLIASHHSGPDSKHPSPLFLMSLLPLLPLPFPAWFPFPRSGKYSAEEEKVLQRQASFVSRVYAKTGVAAEPGEEFADAMRVLRHAGPLDYHGSYHQLVALLGADSRKERLKEVITSRWEDRGKVFQASSPSGPHYIPTLVLCGESDPVSPYANSVGLHEAIPGSRLVCLPGLRHRITHEWTNSVIREVIRTIELRECLLGSRKAAL